jgi:hypothetical protein
MMRPVIRISCLLLLSCLVLSSGISCVSAQSIPYRTDFESPSFTSGDLGVAGQNGWIATAGAGSIQNATANAIRSGVQSLKIFESSVVSKTITGPSSTKVYIDGFYRGPTVDTTPDPTTLSQGSSLILFHTGQGIMALDGNGTGGGTWIAPNPAIPVSSSGLQRITIAQDYSTKTWTLYVNKSKVLEGIGFKNDSITQLSGIDIETSEGGSGYLDDFAATLAPPDFIINNSLFAFSREWADSDETDFDYDYPPVDEHVNALDLIQLLDGAAE